MGAGRVVSAVTDACLGVTGLAVSVAGTKHTRAVRPETWSLSSVAREAHLTELPAVSHRTGAGLHPGGRHPGPRASAYQGDIIQIPSTSLTIRPTDFDRGQIV